MSESPHTSGAAKLVNAQKKQRRYYSGKQRWHTLKAQVVVDDLPTQIVCTAFGKGRQHDFRLFKASRLPAQLEQLWVADRGYQGLTKFRAHSCTPYKKSRHRSLSQQERQFNRQLAQVRITVEHTIRKLKVFRILSERYRDRRKRFGLRFNLIAGLLNYELARSK